MEDRRNLSSKYVNLEHEEMVYINPPASSGPLYYDKQSWIKSLSTKQTSVTHFPKGLKRFYQQRPLMQPSKSLRKGKSVFILYLIISVQYKGK